MNIEYKNPVEAMEDGEAPQHRFEIKIDGKVVGAVEINYFSKPLPLYQLTEMYIEVGEKGKGYASRLMEKVEEFLIKRKKPGVLVDAIMEGDSASGMYKKRGWVEVLGSYGLHVYNWPEDVDLSVLKGYPDRYTPILERSSFKDRTQNK